MADGVRARAVWGILIASVALLITGWAISRLATPWWPTTVAVAALDRKPESGDAGGCRIAASEASLVGQQGQVRPYLGITYLPVNPQVASRYGLEVDWGVLVTAAAEGGPADRAGIRTGDLVLFFNGLALGPEASFLDLLWHQRPGATVRLVVWREGRHFTTEAVLLGMQ